MNLTSPEKILFALALLLTLSSTAGQSQTPVFDQLVSTFERGEVFHATFTHNYHDSYTGEHTRTDGEIWISSEMYRVESDEQIMVVDGEISRVYDPVRNRLLISTYIEEEDDFAPSRMLQGVDESYSISEEEMNPETRVTLLSDDLFAVFSEVEILVGPGGSPLSIEAADQVDNRLITRFENGRFLDGEDGLFEMDIPEDAERIDLRH